MVNETLYIGRHAGVKAFVLPAEESALSWLAANAINGESFGDFNGDGRSISRSPTSAETR
jgi:hypothetical protein